MSNEAIEDLSFDLDKSTNEQDSYIKQITELEKKYNETTEIIESYRQKCDETQKNSEKLEQKNEMSFQKIKKLEELIDDNSSIINQGKENLNLVFHLFL